MTWDAKGDNNRVMVRETWVFPYMCHRMKLAHLGAKQHKIMVGGGNDLTISISSLERRSYSPGGLEEKFRLSVHPLCWSSVHAGRSFKGQLKSPPMIMGPVHVLAAIKLGLKFIGSLLVETGTSMLEWRGISIDWDTKNFQWLGLNGAHGDTSFISIDPLLLTDVICPHGKARDHCSSTWSR